ncbi:MAG: RNA-binding transcriptional accessory protein [Bacteroidetes bacterium]|nr:MAG: RNA-binding transcriptional accessory protein [Bacteroidota bacterium]
MAHKDHYITIALELNLRAKQVLNTMALLDEGATVPFIARYRKEMTGSLDEVAITAIRNRAMQLRELDKRREAILGLLEQQGNLSESLKEKILEAESLAVLEDCYLPYRPKRRTRASMARERGLEPLAKMLMKQSPGDVHSRAERFVNPEKGVTCVEEALKGASDIVAEWVSEHPYTRKRVRKLFEKEATIAASAVKDKAIEGEKYATYFSHEERLAKAPSHRILAMFRGEKEGFLKLTIRPNEAKALTLLRPIWVKNSSEAASQVYGAVKDAYKRLLAPSIETEIRAAAKEKADGKAIGVFADNLRQLLMAPPLGGKRVLAIDPGFRTGCKVVCLDKNGNLLHNETIYPHPPESAVKQSINKLVNLVDTYEVEAIAIGNGTAGRETESFVKRIRFSKPLMAVVVNESGASVYSASKIAREEFPEYDVTVRGAVSIGRRLMDPLAELVKIDPKSIGVGQYQHDVNQGALQQRLDDVVVSCVNRVGVEVNTSSKHLLTYISGLGPALAQRVIDYRTEHGPFTSREELKKIPRFGAKAFEQSAGFLRIRNAANPLDESAVHPESYYVVEKFARKLGCDVRELVGRKGLEELLDLNEFVDDKVGLPTLKDMVSELSKPGRDPRQAVKVFEFDPNVRRMEDLVPGMELPGIVTNITAFGAFVDVGVHQDGLVHLSQMANRYVSDPNDVVRLNQHVRVRVLEVDLRRKRIQLSMKEVPPQKQE